MIDFKQKKFGLISLGCDKNRVDAEKLLAQIQNYGCVITDKVEIVNVLIINTCAFLNDARAEAIDTILSFAQYKNKNLEQIGQKPISSHMTPRDKIKDTFNMWL